MTQIVIDRTGTSPVDRPDVRPLRTRRPAQGSGRTAGPVLRPVERCPAPALAGRPVSRARACALPAPERHVATVAAPQSAGAAWRLTDRGVAVVLMAGLMIMVAALTVVGLTAFRVTGDSYQPSVTASLPR